MLPFLREGLVLEMHFNELVGTIAYDLSGYSNNGTIYGATRVNEGFVRALHFDGVDDYVSIPHSSSLDLKTALTLSAWVYRTRAAGEWIINKNYDAIANTQYGFFLESNHAINFVLNGATRVSFIMDIIGKWTHIVCTWDKSLAKIYVNGELKASASYTTELTSQPYALTLATRKTTGGVPGASWFNGSIDEVLIYNRALSESEIRAIYDYYMKKKFEHR